MASAEGPPPPKALKFGDKEWLPDSSSANCMRCNKPFIIFTRRRHHCRGCGELVCHPCSTATINMRVEYGNKEVIRPVRVCVKCERQLPAPRGMAPPTPGARKTRDVLSNPFSGEPVLRHDANAPEVDVRGYGLNDKKHTKEGRLFYRTRSVCPQCAVVDAKGFDTSVPARVCGYGNSVCLVVECDVHGAQRTVISEDVKFFSTMLAYQQPKSISDIEELGHMIGPRARLGNGETSGSGSGMDSDNFPLILELCVFERGKFTGRAILERQLAQFDTLATSKRRYIVQFNCGLVEKSDIGKLNHRLRALEKSVRKGCPVLVNMPYDRMIDISCLPDTIFLKSRIYPMVKYLLIHGSDQDISEELTLLVEHLKEIKGIKLLLDIVVEAPAPDLTRLMAFFFKNRGFIPLLTFSVTRSPTEIYRDLVLTRTRDQMGRSLAEMNDDDSSRNGMSSNENVNNNRSLAPEMLVKALKEATDGAVSGSDMAPLSVAQAFEQFFRFLGQDSKNTPFNLRPATTCGFGVFLLPPMEEDKTGAKPGIPLSRVFDLSSAHKRMITAGESLSKETDFGSAHLNVLKSVMKSCTVSRRDKLAETLLKKVIASIGGDNKAAESANQFLGNIQGILIHAHMDYASIDAVKRCHCSVITPSASGDGYAASCSRCF